MIKLAHGITTLNMFVFEIAKWVVYLIAGLMIFEVITQSFISIEISWAAELARLLFGPFFLFGGPYLLHMGGHVAVDIVSSKASGKWKIALAAIGIILAFIFGAILLWFSIPLALDSYTYGETSYSGWNPIIWPMKATLPVAAALLIPQSIAELLFLGEKFALKSGESF
jgi:TRAP-type mannitol/chloroaromatic compound transport system permease small subunit